MTAAVPPVVTVVLPTVGRGELRRAIDSALTQTVPVEVVVVWDVDADVPAELTTLAATAPVRVLRTVGGAGGAVARNIGVDAAATDWVAFLDDDDTWLPDKLAIQLQVAEPLHVSGRSPVVSCQSFTRSAGQDQLTAAVPAVVYRQGPVEDYLFLGRRLGFQRPALHVPTILTTTAFARQVGWDPVLRRHQDWDWILRAAAEPDFVLVQVEQPLAIVAVGSSGSVSASPDWVTSWEWGRCWRDSWNPRTYADFMVGQVVRQALVAGDPAAALMAAREAISVSRPSAGTTLLGASAVVPRRALTVVAQGVGRIRGGSSPKSE
jgi:glycosyltransferase involved in cell wall biosynthesis